MSHVTAMIGLGVFAVAIGLAAVANAIRSHAAVIQRNATYTNHILNEMLITLRNRSAGL